MRLIFPLARIKSFFGIASMSDTERLEAALSNLRQPEADVLRDGDKDVITAKTEALSTAAQKLGEKIVRPIGGYGMPEWLRVTIGSETENARFLEALSRAI